MVVTALRLRPTWARPHPHEYLPHTVAVRAAAAQVGGDRLADIDRQRQLSTR